MRIVPAGAKALARALFPAILLSGVPAAALAADDIVLAVCEGTFSGASPAEIVDKYHPLADALGKALKAHVVISPVCSFGRLESGIGITAWMSRWGMVWRILSARNSPILTRDS